MAFAAPLDEEVFVFEDAELFDLYNGSTTTTGHQIVLRKLECIHNVVNTSVASSNNVQVQQLWAPVNTEVTSSIERLRGCGDLEDDEAIAT